MALPLFIPSRNLLANRYNREREMRKATQHADNLSEDQRLLLEFRRGYLTTEDLEPDQRNRLQMLMLEEYLSLSAVDRAERKLQALRRDQDP